MFYDEFTGWSMGEFETVDNVEKYITGSRKDFPLTRDNGTLTIRGEKGSKIIEQDLLLVFVK